jgi:cytochrome P450 PksS
MTTAATESLEQEVSRLFGCDPAALADPYPIYRRLREERPVMQVGPLVVVSRFDDVEACYENTADLLNAQDRNSTRVQATVAALSPEDQRKFWELFDFEALMVFAVDAPAHGPLRRLLAGAFTARRVEAMRERVAAMASSMLDTAVVNGEIELMSGLAYELPLYVICDMLGVPEGDRPQIRRWSMAIGNFIGNYSDIPNAFQALQDWRVYQREMVARQREHPTGDMMVALLAATDEGQRLTNDQLDATVIDLLFAGHETTTNTLCAGIATFAQHPEAWAALRADPSFLDGAVEEVLRYCGSVHTNHRVAKNDFVIAGHPVRAGQTVRLLMASANRDAGHFTDPETFDIRRKPQRVLTFGKGIHFCLGAALARLEISVVLRELVRRYERIELIEPVLPRRNFGLQGPEAVRLRLAPADG